MPRSKKKLSRRDSKESMKEKVKKELEKAKSASEQELKNEEKEKRKKEEERARSRMSLRKRRNLERVEMLARPNSRRLRDLWNEKCSVLPRERRDKIKSALEEDYFLSPEQTEQYFLALKGPERTTYTGPTGLLFKRKEQVDNSKELRQRQAWLVNFSAQSSDQEDDFDDTFPLDTTRVESQEPEEELSDKPGPSKRKRSTR